MQRGIVWCPHCGSPHPLGTKVCPETARSLERTVMKAADHPFIGMVIGSKYVLTKHLGHGAMGSVFEAENRVLRRLVAVKLVEADASPDAVARLEREAQLVSAVQHPNICDIYDVGVLPDGRPFLVLERLFGETFAKHLQTRSKLAVDVAFEIFSQLLSGVQAAHGAKIVHRDLKPENVFLVDRLGCAPLVKILDFGIAKDLSGLRVRSTTRPGKLVGTMRYMAPEALMRGQVDHRADLYAVGLMLFESLTGHVAYEDPRSAPQLSAERVMADMRAARPELSPRVAEVVAKALATLPDHRFPNAVAFQRALAVALDREPPSENEPVSSTGIRIP